MGRIEVAPEGLGGLAVGLHGVAGGVQDLASRAGGVGGGGLSGAAGEALGHFASSWHGGLSRLGGAVHELGACTSAAGALYSHTDETVMPR